MLQALILAAHRIPQPKGINQTHGVTLQPPRELTFSASAYHTDDALQLSREEMRALGYLVIDIVVEHFENLHAGG